jgi:hypothetical protein
MAALLDAKIEFDAETHVYTINGDSSYRSVTTVLSSWFRPFDPQAAIRSVRKSGNPKYFGLSDSEILKQWEHKRNNAAQLGTQMHANIEAYLQGKPVHDNSREFLFFQRFMAENHFVHFGIELRLYYEPVKLVGTIDYVTLNKDGTVDIYDWKRSGDLNKGMGMCLHPALSHIPDTKYWRYTLQLNLYKFLLEKNGHRVRNMYIACFHPENMMHQIYQVQNVDVSTCV